MTRGRPRASYIPRVTGPHRFSRAAWPDALLALLPLATFGEVLLRTDLASRSGYPMPLVAAALGLVVLPLVVRRRFPFAAPVLVWVLAAALSFVVPGVVVGTFTSYLGGIVSAFLLGHLRAQSRARLGLVVVVVAAAILMGNDPTHTVAALVLLPGFFALVWLTGLTLRSRSDQAEAAEQRALVAERERESTARLAAAEERGRIARELHDVVAHSVSVMVLQVGAVRHRMPADRAEDRQALQDVEHVGRAALTEMRRLLGALANEEVGELAPQPGLGDLDALVEKVRRTGLDVGLHVAGEPTELPRAVDLSAYRIVQEGLTNVLKHASAGRADVTVRYEADGITLEVKDDGVGAATGDGAGRGLVGIGERVKIYGGRMAAGAAPGGGYLLTAILPIDGAEA